MLLTEKSQIPSGATFKDDQIVAKYPPKIAFAALKRIQKLFKAPAAWFANDMPYQ
jgi:hypothetical protein